MKGNEERQEKFNKIQTHIKHTPLTWPKPEIKHRSRFWKQQKKNTNYKRN